MTKKARIQREEDVVTESDVESFKRDLGRLDVLEVIRKHVTTGMPLTIDNETYWSLRNKVALKFDIHPNDVIVVGSSRLGFSLKKHKRFDLTAPKDVDIAIVSERLFGRFWDMVFDVVRFNRSWPYQRKKNTAFVSSLFSGWITPHQLPNLSSFKLARDWSEFFDELTQERVCGIRGISARLYRDWSRLEAYQEIMINECKRELERN